MHTQPVPRVPRSCGYCVLFAAVFALLSACVRPTYLGGAAIRPEDAAPIRTNHSLARGETIYSLPSRVTAQADTFSIEALASYRCPGNRVPCVPSMVKLSFEFILSKRVRIPMPRNARAVIDGTPYAIGEVVYDDVEKTPYGNEWRPPYTFEVFVFQERFSEMAEASSVLMDFGGFSFKLSDRVLSGFRRMSREMLSPIEAAEEEEPGDSNTMIITPEEH